MVRIEECSQVIESEGGLEAFIMARVVNEVHAGCKRVRGSTDHFVLVTTLLRRSWVDQILSLILDRGARKAFEPHR